MNTRDLLEYSYFMLFVITLSNLCLMWRKKVVKQFVGLYGFLWVSATVLAISIPLMFFRKYTGLDKTTAYAIYFYSHWVFAAIEIGVMIAIVYNIFHQVMLPLSGLHRIGKVVFHWVSGVSMIVALVIAIGPHFSMTGNSMIVAFASGLERTQEGVSVLILCLLLFVCFSAKPLGLTYRSRIFGVALGLGVYASMELVQAAWLTTSQAQSIYSPMYLVSTLGACVAYSIWGVYFALPEPERKIILLPTTSPYHFWNRLSEALGDNPGHVALSGIKPSPVEMKIMAEMGRVSRERESVAATEAHGVEHDELVDSIAAS